MYSVGVGRDRPATLSNTWSDGTLSIPVTTGTYYLFLDVYNSADAKFSNAADYQLTFGPFKIDLTPPSNVRLTYPVSDSTSGTHLSISQLPIRGIGGVDVLNSSTVRIFIDGRHTTSVNLDSDSDNSDKAWETGTVVLGYGAHTIQAYSVDSVNNQTENSKLLDFYIDAPVIIDEALPDGTLTGVVSQNVVTVTSNLGFLGKGLQETIINSEVGESIGYLAKGIEDTLGPNPAFYFQKGLALSFSESSFSLPNFGFSLPLPKLAINLSYLQKGFEMQMNDFATQFGFLGFDESNPYGDNTDTVATDNFLLRGLSNIANAITASRDLLAYNFNPEFFGRFKTSSIAFFEHTFDPRATKITNTAVEMVTATSAVITWQTNHLATSEVNYGLTATYGTGKASDDLTYWHILTLTDLNPGTKYYFEVMSKNGGYVYDSYHSFETK